MSPGFHYWKQFCKRPTRSQGFAHILGRFAEANSPWLLLGLRKGQPLCPEKEARTYLQPKIVFILIQVWASWGGSDIHLAPISGTALILKPGVLQLDMTPPAQGPPQGLRLKHLEGKEIGWSKGSLGPLCHRLAISDKYKLLLIKQAKTKISARLGQNYLLLILEINFVCFVLFWGHT